MSLEKLGRDVFIALGAIARADGKVESEESAAILRAARDEGLGAMDLAVIEAAMAAGAQADLPALSQEDGAFVYAVAYWIARVDGEMSEEEDLVLSRLGATLSLPDSARMAAEELVDEVAAMPEGDRPARYDLQKLRATVAERLRRALAH